ncbi:hypothetical protein RBS12_06585 [Sinomonas sp. ASV322]|nr:hypothetical protein [Sinomonas sp. ASV322]
MFGAAAAGREFVVWSPVVGLARSALAFATFLTLIATPTSTLFQALWDIGPQPICTGVNAVNWFCMFNPHLLDLGKILACVGLVLVMSGYLPQVTSLVHYWISFSVFNGIAIPDGGDQITVVLALLLVPICVTDPRTNHWHAAEMVHGPGRWRRGWSTAALVGIKIQMSILYLQSCIEKTAHDEWAIGNNLYYTATGVFGFSTPVRNLLGFILDSDMGVSILTWSVLALEFTLAIALVIPRRFRPHLFLLAVLLHGGIALFMGLWSFAIAMIAADLLLTLPFAGEAYSAGYQFTARRERERHVSATEIARRAASYGHTAGTRGRQNNL